LADPDTKRMVQAVSANPAIAPQYNASLAEIFQLQKMLERISTPMPAPQTTTVYDDLKNAALQQASSGMLGEPPAMMGQQQPMQEPPMQAAQGGLMGLPVHNFRHENYAGGGIVAFNGEDNDQEVKAEKETSPFLQGIRNLLFSSPEKQGEALARQAQYNEQLRQNKLRPGYFERMTPSERTRRQTEYDAIQAASNPAGYAEAGEQRGLGAVSPGATPTITPDIAGAGATPTGGPVRPVRPAGLATPPAPAQPAEPSEGEKLMKAAQAAREARVQEAKPQDRAAYRSEIEQEYKAAGIGGADKAEKERITEQRARAKEQYGKSIDLAGFMAGMKMAAAASRRGATFLGSAAEGGSEFGAQYGKAMEQMAAMQTKLDDKETNLARLEEARKMGIIDKTDARLKEARAEYKEAQNQALNLQEKGADLIYGKEVQEKIAKLDRESRERVANLQVAATRAGQYNAFRDLMGRLDKVPKEQHAEIIAQFEKASGAVGAGFAAERRLEGVTAAREQGYLKDKNYQRNGQLLTTLRSVQSPTKENQKMIEQLEAEQRRIKDSYGGGGAGANTAYTAGDTELLKKYGLQ
jgi:hypothetical protein